MNETTLSKMKQMKLYGMHDTFKTAIETGKNDSYTLDRLVHDAHRIELKGESLRKTRKRTSEKPFNMPN